MIKKNLWIVALLAITAIVFMGCPDSWGDLKDKPKNQAGATVTIEDPAEIGAILFARGWNGNAGANVSAEGNVAHFNIPASGSTDNQGFEIDFSELYDGHIALEVTFKLAEVTTLSAGQNAKIGFKSSIAPTEDVKPYADYEIVFGSTAGVEVPLMFPLSSPNKLPNSKLFFSHNKYGDSDTAPNKGSEPPVNYKVEITKISLIGGDVFVPVKGINDVPAKGVKQMPIALPANASPDTANNTDIVWTIKAAGTTGAILAGNVLNTTATGKVTVTGTVEKGTSETEAFAKDFEIEIVDPNGVVLANFSAGTPGGSAADDMKYNAETKAWAATGNWKKVTFDIGSTLSVGPNGVQTVTIVYTSTADARFGFAPGSGANAGGDGQIRTSKAGVDVGDYQGFYDLDKADSGVSSITIKIPDIADFSQFIIQGKGAATSITILAVYFENKGVCPDCGGLQDDCFCYIPITSITGVPAGGVTGSNVDLTKAAGWPSYAKVNEGTPATVNWTLINAGGTGAKINSGKIENLLNIGKVKIRATISNGIANGKDFVQEYEINISEIKWNEKVVVALTANTAEGFNFFGKGPGEVGKASAAMADGKLKLTFDPSAPQVDGQPRYSVGIIPLTAEQTQLFNDVRTVGGTFKVAITGSCDSGTATFRSCFGDATAGSWNRSTMMGSGGSPFTTFADVATAYSTNASTATADDLKHLIIQQTQAPSAAVVTIEKIEITLIEPVAP